MTTLLEGINTVNNTETKKRAYILLSVIALLGILSVIFLVIIFNAEKKSATDKYALIYQDGKLLYSINLSDIMTPCKITITGDNGSYNTILADNGRISMSDASCPDKICVHTGSIDTAFLPIVCIPNKIVIQIKEASSGSTIDAVTN